MGYYVKIKESTFRIPAANLDAALVELKALNHKPDVEKHGGHFNKDGAKDVRWFSWMPEDYDKHVKTAEEVFVLLGFECEQDPATGDLLITDYDNKTGQEELFLDAVKNLVNPDSFITWMGEEGEMWRWTPEGVWEPVISWRK
jgi:hypothetical protein